VQEPALGGQTGALYFVARDVKGVVADEPAGVVGDKGGDTACPQTAIEGEHVNGR